MCCSLSSIGSLKTDSSIALLELSFGNQILGKLNGTFLIGIHQTHYRVTDSFGDFYIVLCCTGQIAGQPFKNVVGFLRKNYSLLQAGEHGVFLSFGDRVITTCRLQVGHLILDALRERVGDILKTSLQDSNTELESRHYCHG